jgi:hypothetical protein
MQRGQRPGARNIKTKFWKKTRIEAHYSAAETGQHAGTRVRKGSRSTSIAEVTIYPAAPRLAQLRPITPLASGLDGSAA